MLDDPETTITPSVSDAVYEFATHTAGCGTFCANDAEATPPNNIDAVPAYDADICVICGA